MPAPKSMFEYQLGHFWEAYNHFLEQKEIKLLDGTKRPFSGIVLAYCVSGGKTLMSVALSAKLLEEKVFTHVIIAVPSRSILDQFEEHGGVTVNCSYFDEAKLVDVPHIRSSSSEGRTGIQELERYLNSPNGEIMVVTYPVLCRAWRDGLFDRIIGKDLSKILLGIDEAQHVYDVNEDDEDARVTARAVSEFKRRGGKVLKLSGTPFRSDGEKVCCDDEVMIIRSLTDHMIEGYAPNPLLSQIIHVKGEYQKQEGVAGDITRLAPKDSKLCAKEMLRCLEKDDFPKTLVRIRNSGKDTNDERIKALTEAVRSRHRWIISAKGDPKDIPEFNALLALENGFHHRPGCRALQEAKDGIARLLSDPNLYEEDRSRVERLQQLLNDPHGQLTYADLPDVVITISRAGEGVNLPNYSNVYFWGVPQSMALLEQVLGRTMRIRVWISQRGLEFEVGEPLTPGYPESAQRWLTCSQVVFFVGAGSNVNTDQEHIRVHAQLSSYLAVFKYLEFLKSLSSLRIRDGMEGTRERQDKTPEPPIDPKVVSVVLFLDSLVQALHQLLSVHGKEVPTVLPDAIYPAIRELSREEHWDNLRKVSELVEMKGYREVFPFRELSLEEVKKAYTLGTNNKRVIERLTQEYRSKVAQGISETRALELALDIVARELQDLLVGEVLEVSGELRDQIAKRMQEVLPRVLSGLPVGPHPPLEDALAGWEGFRQTHDGVCPSRGERDPLSPAYSFADHQRHFRSLGVNFFLEAIALDAQGVHWFKRVRPLVSLRSLRKDPPSPTFVRQTAGKDLGQRLPEVVYFRNLCDVCKWYPRIAPELSIEQAIRLGNKYRLKSDVKQVRRIVAKNGIPGLVAQLEGTSLEEEGYDAVAE